MSNANEYTNPTSVEVNKVLSFYKIGNYENAYINCKNLITKYPNSPLLYNLSGVINTDKKVFQEAIFNYLSAIRIEPNYAQVYNNLGVLLKKLGEINTSIISYLKAINLKPNYIQAYNNLGLAYFDSNEIKKAQLVFLKALRFDYDNDISNFNLGTIYYNQKKLNKAEIYFKKAIKSNPKYTEAYYNLAIIYHDQNKLKLAEKYYKNTLVSDPTFFEAEHILNSISGKTTKFAPRRYVENLFDNYAQNFEKSLIENLNYKTPKIIKEIILNDNKKKIDTILDLGCGTGLIGLELQKHANYIDGIDLSKSMLEKAHNKGIYNKLFHEDIEHYLSYKNLDYEYFIASDVFVYIGDLSNIFKLIRSRNKRNGILIFSTEHNNKKDFFLTNKGRYSHSKNYIENLCKKFDYTLLNFQKTKLRKEHTNYIIGGIYHLKFTKE